MAAEVPPEGSDGVRSTEGEGRSRARVTKEAGSAAGPGRKKRAPEVEAGEAAAKPAEEPPLLFRTALEDLRELRALAAAQFRLQKQPTMGKLWLDTIGKDLAVHAEVKERDDLDRLTDDELSDRFYTLTGQPLGTA